MNTHEELAPEFRDVLIRKMQTASPFWDLLGLELTDVRKGWARVRLAFDRKLVHPLGIAHGGTIFSAADSAVAMALIGMVDRSETFTTVEMKLNYLKPFERGSITAEAVIVHKGSRTALGEVEVRDDEGNLVAKGLATYMILEASWRTGLPRS
jgi:acyl-CoA thioesterase